MTRLMNNSIAAAVAVILAVTSIGAIVTVPPAQAQGAAPITQMAELA